MRPFTALLLLLTLLLWSLNPASLSAQEEEGEEWTPGVFMQQATNNVFEKASLLNALSEYGWSNQLCLAGALLDVGATIALDVDLIQGESYTFIGGGDEDVHDLDLYVVNEAEEVIASDVEDDDTPIPDFVAPYTGRYSIRMQLISGNAQTSFVALALLNQSGNTIEELPYGELSNKFFAAGGSVNTVSSGVKWHDSANQWSVFGLLLDEKESWEVENLWLQNSSHYLYASAGPEVSNVDLFLADENGKKIIDDQENDPYPVLETTTSGEHRYVLRVTNVKSKGRALILLGIVTE